ncbi:MAG: hypothetical protein IKQ83_04065, partial [Lachnospiraceae bacterium]|nr:hypothetical protein [Lachnospiraceae bacterium]
ALADKLAAKKAAMSSKEIKAVVDATAAYNEWNDTTASVPETIQKLVTAKASKIEITKPEYKTTVEDENGVKVYTAEVDNEASYYRYFFDLSDLSVEEVQALNEYVNFLGLSTTNRSQEEVDNEYNKYMSGFSARISANVIDGKSIPSLVIGFYAFPENLEKALDLTFDMLYNTDLISNTDLVGQYLYYFYSDLTDPESMFSATAGLAGGSSDYSRRLAWVLNGIPRFKFLETALMSEEGFEDILVQMTAVKDKVVKRQNGVVYVIGKPETFKASKKLMLDRFPAKLENHEAGSICSLEKTPKTSAIVMNTNASYMLSFYQPKKEASIKATAARMVAFALLDDQLYTPQLRFVLGAYGGNCGASQDGYAYSQLYRAPSFTEAYDVIAQAPDYLSQLLDVIETKDLNGYKLRLISELITPSGDLNMAINELYYEKSGKGSDIAYDVAKAIRKVSVKDIKKQIKHIARIYKRSGTAIIGTEAEIQANADLFDEFYDMR